MYMNAYMCHGTDHNWFRFRSVVYMTKPWIELTVPYFLVQDCSNFIALAMELLQLCAHCVSDGVIAVVR